jgi:PBP1b-binding outer membrane lipoprotein LpoB
MRSVFTLSAVLVAAFLATACVEGVDEVNEVDDAELEEVEVDLPAAPEPDVVRSPQSFNRSDDPDEGGQIKATSRNAAKR